MNKINIGIDIDSTVFDTDDEIINYIGLYYNETFSKSMIKNDLEDLKGVEKHVIKDAIDLAVSNTNSKMHSNAKDVIKWLYEFYNIYFITYRDPEFLHETIKLLSRLEIFHNLILTSREEGKSQEINNHNIKVMIEDDTETILDIAENTDCTCLIFDQPWNKTIKQDYNLIRMFDWKEIKNYFIMEIGKDWKCEFYPSYDDGCVCDCNSDISGEFICTKLYSNKCPWANERRKNV